MDRVHQKEALDDFIEKWFFNEADGTLKAAFHTFESTAEFEKVLEEHLRKLIARQLPATTGAAPSVKPSWTSRNRPSVAWTSSSSSTPRSSLVARRPLATCSMPCAVNAAAGRAFLLVVGVSGGGKSSLVRAGVLPVLTQCGVIEGVGLWRRAILKPSDCAGTSSGRWPPHCSRPRRCPNSPPTAPAPINSPTSCARSPEAAFALIKGGLSQAASSLAREQSLAQQPEARLVIVVDQLEEMFTSPAIGAADREAFMPCLSALARGVKVWVVATIRGDFYHRVFELPELVALQEGSGQFALPLPLPAEMSQMIREPARAAGLSFEEDTNTKVPAGRGIAGGRRHQPREPAAAGVCVGGIVSAQDSCRTAHVRGVSGTGRCRGCARPASGGSLYIVAAGGAGDIAAGDAGAGEHGCGRCGGSPAGKTRNGRPDAGSKGVGGCIRAGSAILSGSHRAEPGGGAVWPTRRCCGTGLG